MPEIGLRIAPPRERAHATAVALRRMLADWPRVPVRVAGIAEEAGRTVITLAVDLGEPDDVRDGRDAATQAHALIAAIVRAFERDDPALVPVADAA